MDIKNTIVAGYRLHHELGRGGMGVVYLARHEVLDRPPVAVKMLYDTLSNDTEIQQRFRREAKLMASFDHPRLVKLLEYVEKDEKFYIVMEYFPGRSLEKIIGREVGPMSYERAIPIFRQILDGVSFLHDNNIIHRDIKPSNILVDEDDNIKITDFGIAKIIGDEGMSAEGLTKTGTKIGTLWYMSPEQVKGKHADKRSDIYSLGVTLYEMLSGHVPFEYENDFQVMRAHVDIQPEPPTVHYPHIEKNVVDTAMRALSKDPKLRFQSCQDFEQSLTGEIILEPRRPPLKSVIPYIGFGIIILGIIFAILNNNEPNTPLNNNEPNTPIGPYDYYVKGSAEYEEGNYDDAMDYFNKCIELDRTMDECYNNRGIIYYNIYENYSAAFDDFDKAIKYAPDEGIYYSNRALCYIQFDNKREACKDFRSADRLGYSIAQEQPDFADYCK